jgi:hypothetical protein
MPRFFAPLFQARTYLATFDLLLDLGFGAVWFTVFTTAIATGASTLITLVGLPILTVTFYLARGAAAVERRRARAFLGIDIEDPVRRPAKGNGLFGESRSRSTPSSTRAPRRSCGTGTASTPGTRSSRRDRRPPRAASRSLDHPRLRFRRCGPRTLGAEPDQD